MAHRTPISEQKRLVARWRHTGQTMAGFALSVGVPESTFWRWTRKFPARPPSALEVPAVMPRPAFVEVTPASAQFAVRVQLSGHAAIELAFDDAPAPAWFAAVLREVTAC
jgi:hypothetical protein